MGTIFWTHPIRIWRSDPDQRHNLSVVIAYEDIYGEDRWARLMPDDDTLIAPLDSGVVAGTAQLWLPRGIDIAVGYFVQVKKPRVVGGTREPVTAELVEAYTAAGTTLYLSTTLGLEDGDILHVHSASKDELTRVARVYEDRVTIYNDMALVNNYAVGDEVSAGWFYRVISRKTPHSTGPYQVVGMIEQPARIPI